MPAPPPRPPKRPKPKSTVPGKWRAWGPKPKPPKKKPPKKPPVKSGGVGGKPPGTGSKPGGIQIDPQYTQQAQDITGYYSALSDVLKGIGPSIGQVYSDTASDIAGFGQGFSSGLRSDLGAAGSQAASEVGAITGNYLKGGTDVGASYNADAAANLAYGLGAYFPAKSLAEQGAAFQSAAAFLPAAAAQQGLYALRAAQRDATAAAAKAGGAPGAAKASSSLSSRLGYLVDVYGQPILGKNGKPIRLPAEQLSPYQQAQLDLSRQKETRYVNQENYERTQDAINRGFKTRAEQRAVEKQIAAGRQIDIVKSRQAGVIIYKNGEVAKYKGKPITWDESRNTPSSAKGGKPTATQQRKNYQNAVKAAASPELKGEPAKSALEGYYIAKPGVKPERTIAGTALTTDPKKAMVTGGYSWAEAMAYLMNAYSLTKAQARRALIAARWTPPKPKKKKSYPKDLPPRMGD